MQPLNCIFQNLYETSIVIVNVRLTLESVPAFIINFVAKKDSKKGLLRAGELARITGVSTDTLRHYESKGLLRPRRSPNGYREYPEHAAHRVRIIRSALNIGFSLDDLARILKVRDSGGAPCRQVRTMAEAKLADLETLVHELTAMRDELRRLLKEWDGLLDSVDDNEPARLLESLAATDFASGQARLPLKSPLSTRKTKKERR
jgi:MerR family copper efflux transcriptional regulator